jgi:hypothetical protein
MTGEKFNVGDRVAIDFRELPVDDLRRLADGLKAIAERRVK